jgi:hypothetical protein
MDENWISVRQARDLIARNFQVPMGIAQRRVIDAISVGVRVRGLPQHDVWNWGPARWPTHSNPDSGLDYTNLPPNVCASATIDWEKGTLRHPDFSGEVIHVELEENDFGHWYGEALRAAKAPQQSAPKDEPKVEIKPRPPKGTGAPATYTEAPKFVVAWLATERANIQKRDKLSLSDAHERLRKMGLPKIAGQIEKLASKQGKLDLLPRRTRLRELIIKKLTELAPSIAGN